MAGEIRPGEWVKQIKGCALNGAGIEEGFEKFDLSFPIRKFLVGRKAVDQVKVNCLETVLSHFVYYLEYVIPGISPPDGTQNTLIEALDTNADAGDIDDLK